ncbi:hypothetical protein FRB90_001442 [Tulasnella sp. 427]|nr:hypothetical protein FRB90_001442 [Tulasnella sp. 427]
MASDAAFSDPVLQGAFRSIGQHYQTLIDDLTKKNSLLEDENRYVNDQMTSLQDQVEQLNQELHDRTEELANARLQEPPVPQDYDSELMQKLLAASSQIIHAKDEVWSLDKEKRLLEEECNQHRAALEVSQHETDETKRKLEDSEAELLAAQREIAQLKSSNTALQDRLEEERRVYERSVKNKDKVIAELEFRVTNSEKENDGLERSDIASRSPLQENNALPTSTTPVASSFKPTFESRYKQLRKQFDLLESQYDSLRQTHVAEIEKFEATRARWAKYKTSILEGVSKIPGSSGKKPIGNFPAVAATPATRFPRPALDPMATPNASVRNSARPTRIQAVVDKVTEADALDEAEGLNQPYQPRVSALQLDIVDQSPALRNDSPHPVVDVLISPIRFPAPPRAGLAHSSPGRSPLRTTEHLQGLQAPSDSPAETESEPGLSQPPFARLHIPEDDQPEIAHSNRPGVLRGSARLSSQRIASAAGGTGLAEEDDIDMDRTEGDEEVRRPNSPEREIEQDEVALLGTSRRRNQGSAPPPTCPPSGETRPFSALEAAFFIKEEPMDEDPDITVVEPEVITPAPKRKTLQSEKSRINIHAKLLGGRNEGTPRLSQLAPPPTQRSAERPSVLGKRKGIVDAPEAGPSRPRASTASESRRADGETAPSGQSSRKGYDQYKGRGRYAQSSRNDAEQPINALFEIDKTRNGGLDYQYDAVVRNKNERKQMEATDCECCRNYYEVVGNLPPQRNGPQWRSPSPSLTGSPKKKRCAKHQGQVGSGGSPLKRSNSDPTLSPTKRRRMDHDPDDEMQEHRQNISRHRQNWAAQSTPPDYWDIGFPTTQQIVSINQRAEENYAAKKAHIVREAKFWAPAEGVDGFPRASIAHKTVTYDLVFQFTVTSTPDHPHGDLYKKLEPYLEDVAKKTHDEKILPTPKDHALVDTYLSAWKRYNYCTNVMDKELNYYNRHYIKRLEDEGAGAKAVESGKWRFPKKLNGQEDPRNTEKAAADEGTCPVRALALRKWRQQVASKIWDEVVGILGTVEDSEERRELAGQIITSFLLSGADPTEDAMVKLREFSGEELTRENLEAGVAATAGEAPGTPGSPQTPELR